MSTGPGVIPLKLQSCATNPPLLDTKLVLTLQPWVDCQGWFYVSLDGMMAVISLWKKKQIKKTEKRQKKNLRKKANLHQRTRDCSSEVREGPNLIILLLSVVSEGLEGGYLIQTKVRIFGESDNNLKRVSPQLCVL